MLIIYTLLQKGTSYMHACMTNKLCIYILQKITTKVTKRSWEFFTPTLNFKMHVMFKKQRVFLGVLDIQY